MPIFTSEINKGMVPLIMGVALVVALAMPMVFLIALLTVMVSVPMETICAPEAVIRTERLSGKTTTEVIVELSAPAAVVKV